MADLPVAACSFVPKARPHDTLSFCALFRTSGTKARVTQWTCAWISNAGRSTQAAKEIPIRTGAPIPQTPVEGHQRRRFPRDPSTCHSPVRPPEFSRENCGILLERACAPPVPCRISESKFSRSSSSSSSSSKSHVDDVPEAEPANDGSNGARLASTETPAEKETRWRECVSSLWKLSAVITRAGQY